MTVLPWCVMQEIRIFFFKRRRQVFQRLADILRLLIDDELQRFGTAVCNAVQRDGGTRLVLHGAHILHDIRAA